MTNELPERLLTVIENLSQEVQELKQVVRYLTKEVCPWHDYIQTPEELARRKANDESLNLACQEYLNRAKAKNPNLTQEEESELIGDFYMGLMKEFGDEAEIEELAKKLLT